MIARVGDVVHFVLNEGASSGECRPALVVRVQDRENAILRLSVFHDHERDNVAALINGGVDHTVSAKHSPFMPGRWHHRSECVD